MTNFFDRLREERKRLGLNQTNFAAKAGIAPTTQTNYETGKRNPDSVYLAAIAAAGADVAYLLTGVRSLPSEESLSHREMALLDNYRHCADGDQVALERLACTGAQSQIVHETGKKAG